MHIPDGFLDAKTALICGGIAATGLAVALRQCRRNLPPRRVPLLGLSAAFVFAAQMLNFPVAGGTSGHLIGGVLTAVLLGPSAAIIVLTAVLCGQCLLFSDGGLTTLGANIFNMGLIGGAGGWLIYAAMRRLFKPNLFALLVSAGFAAWVSTVVAAVACAGQIAASGTIAWNRIFPAMAGVHMLIGVGEAIITCMVLAGLARARPELLGLDESASPQPRLTPVGTGAFVLYGLLISLGLGLFVSPFACAWDDGLDHTAKALNFDNKSKSLATLAPDYQLPGVRDERLARGLAGAAGTVLLFGVSWGVGSLLTKRTSDAR